MCISFFSPSFSPRSTFISFNFLSYCCCCNHLNPFPHNTPDTRTIPFFTKKNYLLLLLHSIQYYLRKTTHFNKKEGLRKADRHSLPELTLIRFNLNSNSIQFNPNSCFFKILKHLFSSCFIFKLLNTTRKKEKRAHQKTEHQTPFPLHSHTYPPFFHLT